MDEALIRSRDARGVWTLTLNRPASFNALSEEMLTALQVGLDAVAADVESRAVVLAAKGRAFCPGHHLKEMVADPDLAHYQRLFAQCSRMMLSIQKLPVPVIARVQGIATADVVTCTADDMVSTVMASVWGSVLGMGLFCFPVCRAGWRGDCCSGWLGSEAGRGFKRQNISLCAETLDDTPRDRRDEAGVAEGFAGVRVGEVHLDDRGGDGLDRVVERDRRVGKGAGIEDHCFGATRCVQPVDKLALMVRLVEFNFHIKLLSPLSDNRLDVGQSLRTIYFGFARPQQIEIWAVEHPYDARG